MQEPQQTMTSNVYYDLVSVLYHALQAAQTSAVYIRDAEQAGQQQLAQFFLEFQRDANRQAERAKQLFSELTPFQQQLLSGQEPAEQPDSRDRGQAPPAMQSTELT